MHVPAYMLLMFRDTRHNLAERTKLVPHGPKGHEVNKNPNAVHNGLDIIKADSNPTQGSHDEDHNEDHHDLIEGLEGHHRQQSGGLRGSPPGPILKSTGSTGASQGLHLQNLSGGVS